MRDKQRARVTEVLTRVLREGESVEEAAQAVVMAVPVEQSGAGRLAREVAKRTNARAGLRNEGFVVLTNERLLCLGKTTAGRPTAEVRASLDRSGIGSVDYSRGVMSTITVVPATGDTALTLSCGLMLRGSADAMASALGAR
jgi:hypothetical protein